MAKTAQQAINVCISERDQMVASVEEVVRKMTTEQLIFYANKIHKQSQSPDINRSIIGCFAAAGLFDAVTKVVLEREQSDAS